MTDFYVQDHGSLFLLTAWTPEARAWIDEHLPDDVMTFGANTVVVESRYVEPIVLGIIADGLSVKPGRLT